MKVSEFIQEANGWSASINNLVFYSCPKCGTAVVDHKSDDSNRVTHLKSFHGVDPE